MRALPSAGFPLLLCLAAVALGWNLNGHPLLDPDEGRNAEVAREMAQSNDYLVPHLDGLPYLDKPIVYFAAAAVLMEALGPTEAAARLPAYVATLATVALLVTFARRRWGPDAGWLAGIAYATMLLPLVYARTVIFDSTLTLCTTAAILWFFEERPVPAWAAMGVGALTKGPIAIVIPLLVMIPYALATGASGRRLFPWRALGIFAAVALPWFVAVSLRIPEFPHYVFVRETLQRVATDSFHRTGPLWYYLPIVPLAAFPWIVPALARIGSWRAGWRARQEPWAREPLLLAIWVVAPFVLFSVNQSKLPQYALPLMPAFALAAARNVAAGGAALGWRAYGSVAVVLGAALVALARWMPAPIPLTPAERAAIPPTAAALGIVLLGSAALVTVGALRRQLRLAVLGYAVVVMAIPFASGRLLAAVGEDRSAATIAAATAAALARTGGTGAVLGVLAYPPSLPFYLGRPIAVATATGTELTSNYIADYHQRYRGVAGSPLLPAGYWRDVLARCPVPTVFVTRAGNHDARTALAAALPLVAADGRYAVYGPCAPANAKGRGG
ncbi:MAG TPA: glycosyltransferase family 39 protein [Gemmatimonadales bacterium]|nr:glycosyltransferase family 39 protein [Gemmatimonadales bacterium]